MFYLSEKRALKMKEAGKILTSFYFNTGIFGIRRVKQQIKTFAPTRYSRINFRTGDGYFFNRQENVFIRPAVSKT